MDALTGARVFTSRVFYDRHALLIDDGRIDGLVPEDEIPASARRCPLGGGLLAPGFIDLQVNGGGGVLFNDDLTASGVRTIGAAHRRFGTTAFLPTLISDDPSKTDAALLAVWRAMGEDPGEGARVLGIHLEGPFLNPERRGVHAEAHVRPVTEADMDFLCARLRGPGRKLITLAPECVPAGTIRRLTEAGAIVFAGHTAATPAQIAAARAEGLEGFTHLFNAMPPFAGRAPGPVGACMAERRSRCTVILDGVHVDPVSVKALLSAKAKGAVILITDAMPPVGAAQPSYRLYGETITAVDGRCATADGTLAGSALDMATAVRNAVRVLGLDLDDALCMGSLDAALTLGLDHLYGRLDTGNCADLVLLDDDLRVRATWVAGQRQDH